MAIKLMTNRQPSTVIMVNSTVVVNSSWCCSASSDLGLGPVSRKSRELSEPENCGT